jgi:hypothetical protein
MRGISIAGSTGDCHLITTPSSHPIGTGRVNERMDHHRSGEGECGEAAPATRHGASMITKDNSRHHQSTSELAIEPLDHCVDDFEPHRGVVGRLHGVMLMV